MTNTHNLQQTKSPLALTLFALIALLFLSSCATLKKSDCVEGNWSGIGFNDAAAGLKANSQFSAHTKACAKHKISPNKAVYESGYKKGLVQFCTANSGYQRGVSKSEYYGVCPAASEKRFLKGYLSGLDTAYAELTEEMIELRHRRLRAISRHHRATHKSEPDKKIIKKLSSRIDSIESRIDSRRNQRRELRRWHSFWAIKLK